MSARGILPGGAGGEAGTTMLVARGVGKRIGYRDVLRDVNFELPPGRIVAVFGPNGAGKSTLVKILATLARPSAGQVLWQGQPLDRVAPSYRRDMGLVGHATYLYPHLTAEENLRLYGRLYGVGDLRHRVAEVLGLVGLERDAGEPVGTFSRGMQQRLAIGRAVLHRPKVLLLDEPFTGLDQQGQARLGDVLHGFRGEGGTCLMVSHDFAEGLALADAYLILARGRVAEAGECAGLTPAEMARRYEAAVGAPQRAEASAAPAG